MSETKYACTITATEEQYDESPTGTRRAPHTPPHLAIGSTLTVQISDGDGVNVAYALVEITEANAGIDPEILAATALGAEWTLGECGPEWSPIYGGRIRTTGNATHESPWGPLHLEVTSRPAAPRPTAVERTPILFGSRGQTLDLSTPQDRREAEMLSWDVDD